MPVMERVVGYDPLDRAWHETSVIVLARHWIGVSCSCWNHRLPHRLEVIVTAAALYFRPADTDELFREIGHRGPITIEVERTIKT